MHGTFRSRRRARRRSFLAFSAIATILALIAAALIFSDQLRSRLLPDRVALRLALNDSDVAYMGRAYASRHFRPIWLKGTSAPSARDFIARLESSGSDGLSPAKYAVGALRSRVAELPEASHAERIRTELLLSKTYAIFVSDLHTPSARDDLAYTDPALRPAFREPRNIIASLASARSPTIAFERSARMNGFYLKMRNALSRYRRGTSPDRATEAILLTNLDRLRALPGSLGERFVLVNAASNMLWLYEGGTLVDTMRVIVGTTTQQTPQIAGLIRYAIFNPFWNVPPDITRNTYAPRIAADPSVLTNLRMDPWSGFTRSAVMLDREKIDWRAIANGRSTGWLRQRPGGNNAMGTVKFMLPNRLGIYLHDTPQRALFARDPRFFSSGCVRVEDAERLSLWLYGGVEHRPKGNAPEQRIDLPRPLPVYIVYLTAIPNKGHIQMYNDVYRRDRTPETR